MDRIQAYLNSQKGSLAEGIKKAILSEIPVIYVITEDLSLVHEVLKDNQVIETSFYDVVAPISDRKKIGTSNGFFSSSASKKNVFFSERELNSWLENPAFPTVTVLFMPPGFNGNAQDQSINLSLARFVRLYQNSLPISNDKSNDRVNRESLEASFVIVVTPAMPSIPASILPYTRIIRVPAIHGNELSELISKYVKDLDGEHLNDEGLLDDTEYLEEISNNLRGLSRNKIREIFVTVKDELGVVHVNMSNKERAASIIRIIQKEKEQLLETSGILKLIPQDKDTGSAFNMKKLLDWLKESREIMIHPDLARKYAGLRPLKGVIVSGIPGSGKSLMARVVASTFNLPLISMSMGLVMDKHLGDSEHRMAEALRQIEALSPCVVWIDEIEKDMAGINGGESDGGTARRMFAQFLTWMQEKERRGVSCFVFATANDVSSLPPELFRNGRFDAKFYTFMPSLNGCDEIFMGKVSQNKEFYSDGIFQKDFFSAILNEFHKKKQDKNERCSKFLTGADIESVIELSKKKLFVKRLKEATSEEVKHTHIVYGENEFREAVMESLEHIRSYGETNMRDIARCFIGLAQRNFQPAGDELFSTDLLDMDTGELQEPKGLCGYDKSLFEWLKKSISEEWETMGLLKRGMK